MFSDVLLPWTEAGGFADNWAEGLAFVALGIAGALVTIYLFLGEFLPSMGGKAEYEALLIEVEDLSKRRDAQIALREAQTRDEMTLSAEQLAEADRLTKELGNIIEAKEKNAARLRGEILRVGFPLYVCLGGIFAVLFATNALQALLIGFGWTALADRIGLKRELDEKTRKRDEQISKLSHEAEQTDGLRRELRARQASLDAVTGQLARHITSTPDDRDAKP